MVSIVGGSSCKAFKFKAFSFKASRSAQERLNTLARNDSLLAIVANVASFKSAQASLGRRRVAEMGYSLTINSKNMRTV